MNARCFISPLTCSAVRVKGSGFGEKCFLLLFQGNSILMQGLRWQAVVADTIPYNCSRDKLTVG